MKTLEINTPLGLSVSFEKLITSVVIWLVLIESNDLFPVVSAAISDIITSNEELKYFITSILVGVFVMSPFKNFTFFIGSISFKSIDIIFPFLIICLATCVHPPGKDPKSNKLVFALINLYFLLSSINLNEALER